MYNYRLQLQYDGGRYDGWVRMGKDSNSNTIECKIKEIIQKMTGEDIDIYVGCRTEKGVHALNQTANFKLNDNVANVFTRKYAYHTFDIPDIKAMKQAAFYMIGKHDFKAFTTAKKSKSTVRDIKDVEITTDGDSCEIRITADDFLHNMARYMIGMLLDVGSGLKKVEDVENIMAGKDVVMSLPAESYGLFLESVLY